MLTQRRFVDLPIEHEVFPLVTVNIVNLLFRTRSRPKSACFFRHDVFSVSLVRKNVSCNLHDMLWENVLGLTAFRGQPSCALPRPGTIVGRGSAAVASGSWTPAESKAEFGTWWSV